MESNRSIAAVAEGEGAREHSPLRSVEPESGRQLRRAERVGQYRLGARIADGETGATHFGVLSLTAEFSRVVAIKRLEPVLPRDRSAAEYFRSEARINAHVVDEHVVQLVDFIESNGELWQVLEYVDGETLQAFQAGAAAVGRQLPIDVTVAILIGALRGLHAAHEAKLENGQPLGIVHRAFRPRNILIGRSGCVKLSHFGSAKTAFKGGLPDVARGAGHVNYFSPEQARGLPLDRRADVFAAGVVLWEALTGRPLFGDGSRPESAVLRDIEQQAIPAPSSLRAEIPAALDAVLLRALQREPADRLGSALEFAEALEGVLTPAPDSRVGAYLTVYCEARLARRKRLEHAAEGPEPLLDHLGDARSAPPRFDEDEDDDDEVTRFIPSVAPEALLPPPRLPPPRVAVSARPAPTGISWEPTLWAAAAILALAILGGLGWRLLRLREPSKHSASVAAGLAPVVRDSAPPAQQVLAASTDPAVGEPTDRGSVARGTEVVTPEVTEPSPLPRPLPALPSRTSAGLRRAPRTLDKAAPSRDSEGSASQSPSAASAASCDPPTYLGSDGIRHFKASCL